MNRLMPWAIAALAVVVWLVPLQLGFYADAVITDIPTYREAYDHMAAGDLPYRDFALEYPPLAAGLFLLAGALPGAYEPAFSALMLACLVATALGVLALARALGFDRRRQALAAGAVAVSPLLIGNLVETRYDLALAALLAWTLWAAVTGRFRLAWGLLGAATLLKLIPLVLVPVLLVWHRHRRTTAAALRGLAASLAVVAIGVAPFALLAPGGTWDIASYHLERPLQVESTGAAYLMVLHELAGVSLQVTNSFGSQGIPGEAAQIVAAISTALFAGLVAAVAVTLQVLLRRGRPLGDARLFMAGCAATLAVTLATGKVLSPQFLVWLLPVGFLVAGRYGAHAFAGTVLSMLLTLLYFPHIYFDLVDLESLPIAIVVARDAVLVALVAAAWPRPALAGRPEGRVIGRHGDAQVETAVAARYLAD